MNSGAAYQRVVAIDGPAGSGKSTVAKLLAKRLAFAIFETGQLYRAVAWHVINQGIDVHDEGKVSEAAESGLVRLVRDAEQAYVVDVDGIRPGTALRAETISMGASIVSGYPRVRQALLEMQREVAAKGDVVIEGRDIGTVVVPGAQYKFFVTADPEVRAMRRHTELGTASPQDASQTRVELDKRDRQDSQRPIAPLKQAEDALVIDTSNIDVEEVVEAMIRHMHPAKPI